MITNEDNICMMTHKELYNFLNTISQYGPWDDAFDKEFCQKCEPIVIDGHEYAFCEIEGNKCPHCNGNALEWWLRQPVRK